MEYNFVLGIDEVGKGPLAGPVVLCGFLNKNQIDLIDLFDKKVLKDSKKLSSRKRYEIYLNLQKLKKQKLIDYKIISFSAKQIDNLGINKCIYKGVEKIVKYFSNYKIKVYLDGAMPSYFGEVVIKADEKILEVALASIIAKEYRDNYMKKQDKLYPEYNFKNNVGYGTKEHILAIEKYGFSKLHRISFCSFKR